LVALDAGEIVHGQAARLDQPFDPVDQRFTGALRAFLRPLSA
jgi:hypothetical protein